MLTAISSATPLVALVGGSGFVGTAVAEAFATAGWRVVSVSRNPENARHLKPLGDLGQVGARGADVRIPASLPPALRGADAVINLAGTATESSGQSFTDLHVAGARAVAEAANMVGARAFIHVSALGADADSKQPYAQSKGEGEAEVRVAFPEATILRPAVAHGAHDRFTNHIATILSASPSPIIPLAAPDTRLQPVHVHDIAEAMLRITRRQSSGSPDHIYELAGPDILTLREIIDFIADSVGADHPRIEPPAFLARLLARFGFLSGAPVPLDRLNLLQKDNIASDTCPGLTDLGITPAQLFTAAPVWLQHYRSGGRFAISA